MGQFLVLDLDETLIANGFRFARPGPDTRILTLPTDYGYLDRFILRPHVPDFLDWCSKNFSHTILATFSPQQRAESVLDAAGIREYFDLIVSRGMLDESKGLLLFGGEPEKSYDFGRDFCLVDDQGWDSDHVLIKMNFFGVDVRPVVDSRRQENDLSSFPPVEDRFIQASPYEGDPEDDFFLRLLTAFQENYYPAEKLPA